LPAWYSDIKLACYELVTLYQGMVNQDEEWRDELVMLQRAIKVINHMRPLPRFVVVCGDLVNGMQDVQQNNLFKI
jgi:hypothetical protein